MFHLHVSAYINDRLKKTKMTYRDLAARSGVPLSTIYGYARGQVNKPDDDALIRIAAAFGDGEDVIRQMHVASLPSTTEENMIFAAASDQLLLEKLALLIRENFVAVMDDYVSSEERQYRERLATVQAQYDKLMKDMEKKYEERIADERSHHDALIRQAMEHERTIDARSESSRNYLKRLANQRLLIIAVLAVILLASMAYNVYAFRVFDVPIPRAASIVRTRRHKKSRAALVNGPGGDT